MFLKLVLFLLELVPIFYEQDEAKKKALIEVASKETLPYYLPRLEAVVKKNNGHFALGRVSVQIFGNFDIHFCFVANMG